MATVWLGDFIPDAIEVHIAVSSLSPVSIQTFIPAYLKFSIVATQSSYSSS